MTQKHRKQTLRLLSLARQCFRNPVVVCSTTPVAACVISVRFSYAVYFALFPSTLISFLCDVSIILSGQVGRKPQPPPPSCSPRRIELSFSHSVWPHPSALHTLRPTSLRSPPQITSRTCRGHLSPCRSCWSGSPRLSYLWLSRLLQASASTPTWSP